MRKHAPGRTVSELQTEHGQQRACQSIGRAPIRLRFWRRSGWLSTTSWTVSTAGSVCRPPLEALVGQQDAIERLPVLYSSALLRAQGCSKDINSLYTSFNAMDKG